MAGAEGLRMSEQLGLEGMHYGAVAEGKGEVSGAEVVGEARVVRADRKQLQFKTCDLESLLPEDHRARLMWEFVQQLDLSAYERAIRSRTGGPGRPAIDPRILLTLWLYAIGEGVGQARRLESLCEQHDAYRWICGGVTPNYHTLSDFRTRNEAAMDDLLTQTLAVLMRQGIVKLRRVAQDGLRVRASAGKKSFRRRKTLERCLEEAASRVQCLKEENGMAQSARARKAAERAAREREKLIGRALKELSKVEAKREKTRDKRKRGEPRASTTDADARITRMADGGFRPAYNVQLATDAENGIVVGVGVTNGNDGGQVEPMVEDIKRRTQQCPQAYLVDGGYAKLETVEHMASKGVQFYAPLPKPKKAEDPYAARPSDSEAVEKWRERMGSEEGKQVYKIRPPTAERTNADIRHWRGLKQFGVRGIRKVYCMTVMTVLAYDILRLISMTRGIGA